MSIFQTPGGQVFAVRDITSKAGETCGDTSRGIRNVRLGAAGSASMVSLVCAAIDLLKQRARLKEPSYLWTAAFGILGLIGTAASQHL